jgi:hypothetical protein
MRLRSSLFWGLALILLAGLLLLKELGLFTGSVFGLFWPVVLILLGFWLLAGFFLRGRPGALDQSFSVPVDGASSARLKLDHGAGKLDIRAGAEAGSLVSGTSDQPVAVDSRLNGSRLEVKLKMDPQFWLWLPGDSLDWELRLQKDIPLVLDIDNGASTSFLDLSELKVSELDLDTGASTTEITLPADAGMTRADIDTGASTLRINVPAGVAASITIKSGLSTINVDETRFPKLAGGLYRSADYDQATNRAEIVIDSGVGTITIH